MTAPKKYTRQQNFVNDQNANQTAPFNGAHLDSEFDAVQQSNNAIADSLAIIQRSDGQLNNGIVTMDALSLPVVSKMASGATTTDIVSKLALSTGAAGVGFSPSGTLTKQNLQDELAEIDTLKAATSDLANASNGKGVDLIANAAKKVASIAALRALRVPQGSDAQTVIVDGYATAGDGGGGVFQWWPNAAQTDDAGIYINPNGNAGNGRWVRADLHIFSPINARWYGAKGDGANDDASAIQAAINYVFNKGGGVVEVPGGKYKIGSSLIPKKGVTLRGLGKPSRMNGSGPGASPSPVIIQSYVNGAAVLIQTPTSATDVTIESIEIDGTNAGGFGSGISLDANTNGGAIAGVRLNSVTVCNFPNYQVIQDGTVFDVIMRDVTLHNYNRAAGDCYHVGPHGVPGQITFDNCFLIPATAGQWSFRAESACDARFIGGTVGPSAAANGISAYGSLDIYGTHLEGDGSTGTIGVLYRASGGSRIFPSQCSSFGTGVQIGDGTSTAARGYTIGGSVGGFSAGGVGDIVVTSGGPRNGTILPVGYFGGNPTIVDNRWAADKVAEVCRVDSSFPVVPKTSFTPTVQGAATAGVGTYATQIGAYTRTGSAVTVMLYVKWSAHTGTGQLQVNLPIPADASLFGSVSFRDENFAIGAGNSIQGLLNGSVISIETENSGGGGASPLALPASGSLIITAQYLAA